MLQKAPSRVTNLEYRGAPQTVALIREAALHAQNNYAVRQLAEKICGQLRAKDYLSEILAISHFVESHTRYMRDPATVELVRDPALVASQLLSGETPQLDCDDMSALLAALLMAAGCRVRLVTVAFRNAFHKNQRQYSHIYVEAQEPRTGTWIVVDPVAGPNTKQMLARGKAFKHWNI